jgi:hypothetical protein
MGGFSVIDFGAWFSQLLATSWWLPPLFILAALFKSAWFKSKKGNVPFSIYPYIRVSFCHHDNL